MKEEIIMSLLEKHFTETISKANNALKNGDFVLAKFYGDRARRLTHLTMEFTEVGKAG